jgi:hypothetical protein
VAELRKRLLGAIWAYLTKHYVNEGPTPSFRPSGRPRKPAWRLWPGRRAFGFDRRATKRSSRLFRSPKPGSRAVAARPSTAREASGRG